MQCSIRFGKRTGNMEKIRKHLFELQDLKYRDFNAKLIPETDKERIIGVRTPELRKYARTLVKSGEWKEFVSELPHQYHEENCLHGFILGILKVDYEEFILLLDAFLPYVDNWAVCDGICPKIFKKYPAETYEKIKIWLKDSHPYTVRFGLVSLLQYFLDEEFQPEMLSLAAELHREEYYINMAIAWYLSFALIKQYEYTLPLIESKTLEPWIQNKTIQKAIESYRISEDRKAYLRTLKVNKKE